MTTARKSATKSASKLDDAFLIEVATSALEAIAALPIGASDSAMAHKARQIAIDALAGLEQVG